MGTALQGSAGVWLGAYRRPLGHNLRGHLDVLSKITGEVQPNPQAPHDKCWEQPFPQPIRLAERKPRSTKYLLGSRPVLTDTSVPDSCRGAIKSAPTVEAQLE